ncbi:MAG: hypothetical protein BWY70_01297 [Bacteroidetes bacterium ADurb.Bin408]|nr:MAG: hypothetical protein BWY70_01297 [Bacteroidetes bacterium ADurb.Bin408]
MNQRGQLFPVAPDCRRQISGTHDTFEVAAVTQLKFYNTGVFLQGKQPVFIEINSRHGAYVLLRERFFAFVTTERKIVMAQAFFQFSAFRAKPYFRHTVFGISAQHNFGVFTASQSVAISVKKQIGTGGIAQYG